MYPLEINFIVQPETETSNAKSRFHVQSFYLCDFNFSILCLSGGHEIYGRKILMFYDLKISLEKF